MAMYTTYDQVGIKEDISDIISNISPRKTPFQSAIGGEKVHNKYFQWQEDSLRAVTDNAKTEGFTASDSTRTPTTMRANVTQILSDTIKVSGTADAVSTYGRARESAYQIAKVSAELKRDLENALVGTKQTMVNPSDNTSARKMAGYQAQVDTGLVNYTGQTSSVDNPLTETALVTTLQELFDNGAEPTRIMVTPTNAAEIAAFAKAAGRYRTLDGKGEDGRAIVNVIDLYVSPYGEQRVQINRFQASTDTLVFDPDMWSLVTLRPWTRETLAKTGDNLMMMIVGEFSLKHKNRKASAVIRHGNAP